MSVFPTKPVFWCFFGAFEHLPILNLQLPGIEGAAKTTAASSFYRQIIIVVIVYIDVPVFQRRTDSGFCFYSGVPVSIHWRKSYRLASRGICAVLVQIFVCTLNVFACTLVGNGFIRSVLLYLPTQLI